jgi:hypothetical protein
MLTKDQIKAMTMEQRMALIDLIWDVTDEENPQWKEDRNEDEMIGNDEAENTTKA